MVNCGGSDLLAGSARKLPRSSKASRSGMLFTTSAPIAQVNRKVHHWRLQANLIQHIRDITTVISLVIDRVKNHISALHLAATTIDKLEPHHLLEGAVVSHVGI